MPNNHDGGSNLFQKIQESDEVKERMRNSHRLAQKFYEDQVEQRFRRIESQVYERYWLLTVLDRILDPTTESMMSDALHDMHEDIRLSMRDTPEAFFDDHDMRSFDTLCRVLKRHLNQTQQELYKMRKQRTPRSVSNNL